MWEWAIQQYTAATPQVQGAIVSGLITAATAAVGVLVVVMQLRGQAKNAIASNRHNEAIKLKKEIYERIEPIFIEAGNALDALSSYLTGFLRSLDLAKATQKGRMVVPKQTVEELQGLEAALSEKVDQVQAAIYRWHIVDLRVTIFRLAFKVIQLDLQIASTDYVQIASRLMYWGKEPWSVPSPDDLKQIVAVTEKYIKAASGMETTLQDFGSEMQNLLLGEMFHQQIPPMPQDASNPYPRITLDTFRTASAFYLERENQVAAIERQTTSMEKELATLRAQSMPPAAPPSED